MNLKESLDHIKFDTRLIDYNLKHGYVEHSQFTSHLDSLKDLASQAKPMKIESEYRSDSYRSHEGTSVDVDDDYDPIY